MCEIWEIESKSSLPNIRFYIENDKRKLQQSHDVLFILNLVIGSSS